MNQQKDLPTASVRNLDASDAALIEYQDETVSAMLAIPFGNMVVFARVRWSGRYGNRRPN